MTEINALPEELLLEIMKKLPFHDLATLGTVSWRFHALFRDPQLWYEVIFSYYSCVIHSRVVLVSFVFSVPGGLLKSMLEQGILTSMRVCRIVCHTSITEEPLVQLLQVCMKRLIYHRHALVMPSTVPLLPQVHQHSKSLRHYEPHESDSKADLSRATVRSEVYRASSVPA